MEVVSNNQIVTQDNLDTPFEEFLFLDNTLRPFLVRLVNGFPWAFYWHPLMKWQPSCPLKWWKARELRKQAVPDSIAKIITPG